MDTAKFKEMEVVLHVVNSTVADGAQRLRDVSMFKLLVALSLILAKLVINIVIVIHVWTNQLANGVMIPDHVPARNTVPNVTCLHICAPIIAC